MQNRKGEVNMNQEQNNFNFQNNNNLTNNSNSNEKQVVGYNTQTGEPIYNNQEQSQTNTNFSNQQYPNQNNKPKKKKMKWWIPLLFFLGGFVMFLCNITADLITNSRSDYILDANTNNFQIADIFFLLAIICWLMVIPSLIIVIVKYNLKSPEEKSQANFQTNNLLNNTNSLDEKLLIAFIGNNYQQLIQKKFSIPAFFLSWIYTLYRKVYIPSLIGMLLIIILNFVPAPIYSILVLVIAFVLGFNFNKFYINYAKKQINKIKINNPNANEEELINICRKKGGTNIWIALAIYAVFAIVNNLFNSIL